MGHWGARSCRKLVPDSTYEEIIASLEVNLNALLARHHFHHRCL